MKFFPLTFAAALYAALFSLNLQAAPFPSPEGLCSPTSCTSAMQEIYDGFMRAEHEPLTQQRGFSGSCYTTQRNLDPEHEQHGAMIITPGDQSFFSAAFTYFAKDNPYKGMNLQELVKALKQVSPRQHPVTRGDGMDLALIASSSAEFYYWYKTTPEGAWLVADLRYKTAPSENTRIFCSFSLVHQ
jgi:hypothetical protein